MKNVLLFVLTILTLVNLLDCASVKSKKKPCGYGTAEYVLIIGVDGLGGFYLRNATNGRPGFRSFFDQGSFTTSARCHNPSLSAPNWGTILTGMRPEETGINNNNWRPENGKRKKPESQNFVPPISGEGIPETMFKAAKKQNKDIKTYMSFSWDWFVNLYTNDSIDRVFRGGWLVQNDSGWVGPLICPPGPNYNERNCGNLTDYRVYNDTLWTIKTRKPNLMFMYSGLIDEVGHDVCFGCPEYYNAVDIADRYIQEILNTLKNTKTPSGESMINKTLVMLTSDHGGYSKYHAFCRYLYNETFFPNSKICASYFAPAVIEIPVLLRGPGIKKKFDMKANLITNRDVAVTALNALGLDKGQFMTGRILEEAYEMNACPADNADNADNAAERKELPQIMVLVVIFCTLHAWLLA